MCGRLSGICKNYHWKLFPSFYLIALLNCHKDLCVKGIYLKWTEPCLWLVERSRCCLTSSRISLKKRMRLSSNCCHCSNTCSMFSMYWGVSLSSSSRDFSYRSLVCKVENKTAKRGWLRTVSFMYLWPWFFPVKEINCFKTHQYLLHFLLTLLQFFLELLLGFRVVVLQFAVGLPAGC